ncbi:MAG: DNA translocase FtsK [Bacilli bacterium]
MAKKKKRKDVKKVKGYQIELNGIILILIAIIGFGSSYMNMGIVGKFISAFAVFLVGTWYNILLLFVFITGIYIMIKRKWPIFFTSNLVGLYIVVISILIFSHISYIADSTITSMAVIKETINNFLSATNGIATIQGGGILGALFSSIFMLLFDLGGTKIVAWVLLICGLIMFTGVSIYEVCTWIKANSKKIIENNRLRLNEKKIEDQKRKEAKFEEKNKVVISSVDELISVNEEKEETPLVETIEEQPKQKPVSTKEYIFPAINLLARPAKNKNSNNDAHLINENSNILKQVFSDFGIEAKVVAANVGPSVTQYEMEIKAGTKVNKVLSIHREIALVLAAKDVRIQAPIPGKKTVGIEIPNKSITMVSVREILESVPKNLIDHKLLVTLGRDIMGKATWMEIDKTPHLLVAGTTGSGKSVCINSIIISLLMRNKPSEIKLVLIDPKKVELSMYNGVPHLLTPVVTDPKKANIALKKIVVEMERRYELFSDNGVKNMAGYNNYINKKNKTIDEAGQIKELPYIVVIIDELADLMLVAAKEVEDSIMRITQMARAAGIHLIVATQRPSTDVITGVIKANIPARISFAVSSSIDSRTILGMMGAEKLLGKGDMLFLPMGENCPKRIQGTFITEEEIKAVADHTIKQQIAQYDETLIMDDEEMHATTMLEETDAKEEPLYNEIVEFVIKQEKASASLIQRRFRLGYNRAARVIDLMEDRGIIGPSNGSRPRQVLIKNEKEEE